jgi:hypothetical protein
MVLWSMVIQYGFLPYAVAYLTESIYQGVTTDNGEGFRRNAYNENVFEQRARTAQEGSTPGPWSFWEPYE